MKEQIDQARWIGVLAVTRALRVLLRIGWYARVLGLLGTILGPVVLAITVGLLQTFKQENDEGQYMGGRRFSLLIDLSTGLAVSRDEVGMK